MGEVLGYMWRGLGACLQKCFPLGKEEAAEAGRLIREDGLLGIRDKAYQEECLVNPLALGWDPKELHLMNRK